MKVLVTGAAGRVGANVVRRLVSSGAAVRALVLPGDPHASKVADLPGVDVVEGDLCDQDSVNVACREITHVVHLAAAMVLGDVPVDRFYDINTLSTLRLLEGVLRNDRPLDRFILASTDSTYCPGRPPVLPLTEDVRQEPADYYGLSKLLGETILRNRALQFEIPYSIVRFGTVLSPEEAHNLYRLGFLRGWVRTQQEQGRRSTLWPLFDGRPDLLQIIDEAVGDTPDDSAAAFVGPDGPWTLSMVDVRDAAQGVCLALTEPAAVGKAFNVVAAEPTTSEDGAAIVAELYGVPKVTVPMPMNWRLEISAQAAREHLGYRPRYDYRATLEAGLTDSLADDEQYIPAAEGNQGTFAKLSGGKTRPMS